MDDVPRRQQVAAGDLGVAGGAAIEGAAFGEELRTGGAVDRAVDPAAAKQRRVRGIDDGVKAEGGDVRDDNLAADRAELPDQAEAATVMPLSASNCCNSPAWNISRTMSQPPTNSPFT